MGITFFYSYQKNYQPTEACVLRGKTLLSGPEGISGVGVRDSLKMLWIKQQSSVRTSEVLYIFIQIKIV